MKQFWTRRWPIVLAMLVALLLGTSGCAGGAARATSWTGLTVAGDTLYAASLEQVVALNAADGKLQWAFPDDPKEDNRGLFYVTPAVDDNLVLVASQVPPQGFLGRASHVVWALDRETGLKHRGFEEFTGAAGQYIEGGALSDGVFVIGNSDGNVYALDAETGALKWTFKTGHRVWGTPLIVSDTVYVGSMDRHLYALNLSNGRVRWDFHTQGAFASTPVLQDGTLYIGAFDNRFYAIDAETGTERWHFESDNWFWGGSVIDDGIVYASDVEGNVYALRAETGDQIWHAPLDTPVRAGVALGNDGSQLFVGTRDGDIYSLDTIDGYESWSPQRSEGQVLSRPIVDGAIVYESVLYESYRIRALYVETGREVWTWPQTVEE
ncbi:MAG: PQQ-binding-like beta-propeller repeat protein [Chloroflexi bacterium]|nr:PQQ-binding-like beta-propeller repeat protein [Chloroflexota bacterium]